MPNPYDRHFDTAHTAVMKEHATSPPASIVDSFMVGGEAISAITGREAPREKWIVWFAFPDGRSLQLAQREKRALIARTMKDSLKASGYPANLADELDLRFTSKDVIDKAGPGQEFLEQELAGRRAEPGMSFKLGVPLRGSLKGYWKLRVRDDRVVFKVVAREVWIPTILHRKAVYERAAARASWRPPER